MQMQTWSGGNILVISISTEYRSVTEGPLSGATCPRFFYAKICSLLARRRSSQPVQRVYWPENVIDWLGKWRPTCVMRHARGQKLQSFRRKWPFYMDLYSTVSVSITQCFATIHIVRNYPVCSLLYYIYV